MITSAIGKPTPNAPPIINANAVSRFASARTIRSAILLLRRAPAGIARRPGIDDQGSCPDKIADASESRPLPEPQRPKACECMVKKRLT
jgi:hypothetical protein